MFTFTLASNSNKMKQLLTILSIIIITTTQAQNNFEKSWKKVEALELEGKTKSANELVTIIYKKAKKKNNSNQLIKSLLYQSKFALTLQEESELKIVQNLEKEITEASFPTNAILQSILADFKWQYFQQHRWQIYNRTQTDEINQDDFRTWDLNTLFTSIHQDYKTSTSKARALQRIPISSYKYILIHGTDTEELRPTLYDLLTHRALSFFKTDESRITKPKDRFYVDQESYFAPSNKFSKPNIESTDTIFSKYEVLKTYQQLEAFHLAKKQTNALMEVYINRLQFVKNNTTLNNKNDFYIKSLEQSLLQYKTGNAYALLKAHYAQALYDNATLKVNPENRKKALDITEDLIVSHPNSEGAVLAQNLQSRILQPILQLQNEIIIPPNQSSKVWIEFNNVKQVYLHIYQIPQNHSFYKFNYQDRETKINKFFATHKALKTTTVNLPQKGDYFKHSTEALLPSLQLGRYMLLATTNKGFNKNDLFAYNAFTVSNLSIIESDYKGKKTFQVLNSSSGEPIKHATVKFGKTQKNTDDYGETTFSGRRDNAEVLISYQTDSLLLGNKYHYGRHHKPKDESKTEKAQAFLFLDRSIYRPGQEIHFKGIILSRVNYKSNVVTDKEFKIIVRDANYQEIKTFDLTTNEYGSFSEKFSLPKDGLTGNFTIKVEQDKKHFKHFNQAHSYFSVEEYKRPKFEVNFNPVTESFAVNDNICITGIAKALLGTNISDAKVSYNIVRKTQYSHWRSWSRHYDTNEQEIAHGEVTTNDKGEFDINFNALPDKTNNPKNLPIFSYEITANVTDINGETRTATTNVKVGYHTLELNITAQDNWNIDTAPKLNINTTNLNGEFIPAKVNLKIYKLIAPKNILRTRRLPIADMPLLAKGEFKKYFPNEAYTNESDYKNWKKGELIYEEVLDTEKDKNALLPTIKSWQSGRYIIITETTDSTKNDISQEKHISVRNEKDLVLADNQLFDYQILNASNAKKDGFINIKLLSSCKDLTVFTQAYYNSEQLYKEEVNFKSSNSFRIPLTQILKKPLHPNANVNIQFAIIKHQDFKLVNAVVDLSTPQESLVIVTQTFRDKLQPGSKEKWNFTIKNNHKKGLQAEVLASMYDASLDQFKSHNWANNISIRDYYRNDVPHKHCNGFRSDRFTIKNPIYFHSKSFNKEFDKLNHFGFGIGYHYKQEYQNYLFSKIPRGNGKSTIISGFVLDENGLPLPGATVLIKGSTIGTSTDFDGKYTLKIKEGDILEFSYVGYGSQAIKTSSSKNYNFSLQLDDSLEEVVIAAYGIKRKRDEVTSSNQIVKALSGKVSGLQINTESDANTPNSTIVLRGNSSITGNKETLIVIDGKIATAKELSLIDPTFIKSTSVLKGANGSALYGERGANGVIIVVTNSSNSFQKVKARKNLNETAFFYPHLKTDSEGNLTFEFISPEALTRWKLQLFGHTKTGVSGKLQQEIMTQKELMVIPNPPRFLREHDTLVFQTKISSLSDKVLNGQAKLELYNAVTGAVIDIELSNKNSIQNFELQPKGNTSISWQLIIPEGIPAVEYKVLAMADNFTDGEVNVLPVLTNKMLVTESIPLTVRANSTREYRLDKLLNNTSTTLRNHQITLEYTTNPAWYAIQSLPYLMEFPHECAEQTFARYYANILGAHIMNSNPKIKQVFESWKANGKLTSKLEQKEELKQILIAETPWLRDTQSESEKKKQLAILFDLDRLATEQKSILKKLRKMQLSSGALPWFKGGNASENITRHIVAGIGHLNQLNVLGDTNELDNILKKAIQYLDNEFVANHKRRLKYLSEENIAAGYYHLHYLYTRSFFKEDIPFSKEVKPLVSLYLDKSKKEWLKRSLLEKTLLSLISHRYNDRALPKIILTHLQETAIDNEEKGMYWKANKSGWYWNEAPIETQALIIEAFTEITQEAKTIEALQIWLLNNKRKNSWDTTKATTEAVYALLLQGNDWLSVEGAAEIKVGNEKISTKKLDHTKLEAGTGYFKTTWNKEEISTKMADLKIKNKSEVTQYGGYYWQYFEQLDKITNEEHKSDIQLSKKLFLKKYTNGGEALKAINPTTQLKVGDLVKVRIELQVKDDFEFVHLKDMRASAFEPVDVISKYKWQDGLGYYQSTKDVATHFFFDKLNKGTYVLEYEVRVNNSGDFSNGISTIQSMYAPEFTSHSKGTRISVSNEKN